MTRKLTLPRCLLALVLVLFASAAQARSYRVELIVFRQPDAQGADSQRIPLDPPPLEAARVVRPGVDPGVRWLATGRLNGIYQQLQRTPGYEPLLHVAWAQPGLHRSRSAAIPLPQGWSPDSPAHGPLTGLIRLSRERFLHIDLDLRYQLGGDGQPTYVNQQSRRMRSGEIHYLDHPALGAIVVVTPY